MTLPALAELRKLAPAAEIELAVGSWNEELARGLPFVDRTRVVDAPWAAWGKQAGWVAAMHAMRHRSAPDLAVDFQGDVRVILLMALSGARSRAGYEDTGGGYLLTHSGRWDEKRSWYRQSLDLLQVLYPEASMPDRIEPFNFLLPDDRNRGRELLKENGLAESPRPWVGIHPSAGRGIKQWEVPKFAALAEKLVESASASVLVTGAPSDRELVAEVMSRAGVTTYRLVTEAGVRAFSAVVAELDLLVTGDTGPMHIAHAVGAPNLAIFGPSDPVRYGPEGNGEKRVVLRQPLYCSPCNMIRKPPPECSAVDAPECLEAISVDQALTAALDLLGRRRGLV
jgi:ADP-heptose:LPS heptosyltransferase